MTIDGKPWFVAADVRAILGLQKGCSFIAGLKDADKRIVREWGNSPLKGHGLSLISEAGLYTLVMRAQKANPKATEFQNWVTGTVLPAIRKDGMYVQGEEKLDPNNDADLDKLVIVRGSPAFGSVVTYSATFDGRLTARQTAHDILVNAR